MRATTSRQSIRKLTDNLSDTKSWADLAKELEKYAAKASDSECVNGGETIQMADLLTSLNDHDEPTL